MLTNLIKKNRKKGDLNVHGNDSIFLKVFLARALVPVMVSSRMEWFTLIEQKFQKGLGLSQMGPKLV